MLAATATLSLLIGIVPIGVIVVYASNDQNNNNDRNDDSRQNKACYNAGFADGQKNNPYSKTMFNQCGVNSRAYYEGFLSGCISGQGKDFFSCQKLTNTPFGGGSSSNSDGGIGSGSNTDGGGFGPFGGGGSGGK